MIHGFAFNIMRIQSWDVCFNDGNGILYSFMEIKQHKDHFLRNLNYEERVQSSMHNLQARHLSITFQGPHKFTTGAQSFISRSAPLKPKSAPVSFGCKVLPDYGTIVIILLVIIDKVEVDV